MLSFFLLKPTPLRYDVLLNHLDKTSDFKMQIFYSDISTNTIKGFEVSKNNVLPTKMRFKSYTEGFLPSKNMARILSTINAFRKDHEKPPLTYFHDYYEDTDLMIISFTGGLENIYIIDKQTWQVSTLQFDPSDNLGNMYVSHIKRIDDSFVLIGGEVNAYNAFIYTVDAASYSVTQVTRLPTHSSAVYEEHYTIDSRGNALFINNLGIDILTYQANQLSYKPLPFAVQYIFSNTSSTIALSLADDTAHYALFDESLNTSRLGRLTMPRANIVLVDAFLNDSILYMISYDPTSKRYSNYITLYDLTQDKLIYCLGLYPYPNLALLEGLMTTFALK